MKRLVVMILCVGALITVRAQAPAPTLTDADRVKLQVLELRAENAQLKIALLQVELAKVQDAFTTYQREGYTLQKGSTGEWTYTRAPLTQ